jgi:hypothetical protein
MRKVTLKMKKPAKQNKERASPTRCRGDSLF